MKGWNVIKSLIFVASSIVCLSEGFVNKIFASHHRFNTDEATLSLSSNNDETNPALELTNTLARLDKQWKIQQSSKPRSRWTKLVLDQQEETEDPMTEVSINSPVQEDYVYILEPPNKGFPSCLIVFIGGAGLGQFPQIAYNEFLVRLSNKLNAAVITAPYTVGLDHFELAKKVGELSRRAIIHCEDDPERLYPAKIPTYLVAHSLGCKLSSIYMAATGQQYEGIGFISFNNFGFSKTIGMAKSFAEQIRRNTPGNMSDRFGSTDVMDQIFSFAEGIISTIGIDFSPNPAETERILNLKYDKQMQDKTRLFVFDDDTLDSSESFIHACQGECPKISGLPGTHLTPVFFKLGMQDLPDDVPSEIKEMARDAVGGLESASFGDESNLHILVNEVSDWILGKAPSRPPKRQQELKKDKISGYIEGSQS